VFRESGHQQITGGHPVRNNAADFYLLYVLDLFKAIGFRNTILINEISFIILLLPDRTDKRTLSKKFELQA